MVAEACVDPLQCRYCCKEGSTLQWTALHSNTGSVLPEPPDLLPSEIPTTLVTQPLLACLTQCSPPFTPNPFLPSLVSTPSPLNIASHLQTRTFAPQSLAFLATGAATLITFASVPLSSTSTQPLTVGPAIAQLAVHAGTCGHA